MSQRSERVNGGAFGRAGLSQQQRAVVEVDEDGRRKRSGGADVRSWREGTTAALLGAAPWLEGATRKEVAIQRTM